MLTVQRPNEMRIKGANSDLKSNNLNLTSPQKPVSKNQKDRINKHQTLQKDQSSSSSVFIYLYIFYTLAISKICKTIVKYLNEFANH